MHCTNKNPMFNPLSSVGASAGTGVGLRDEDANKKLGVPLSINCKASPFLKSD